MKSILAGRQISKVITGLGLAALILVAYMLFLFIHSSIGQVNDSLNRTMQRAEQYIVMGTHN